MQVRIAFAVDVDPDYTVEEGGRRKTKGKTRLSFVHTKKGLAWLLEFLREERVPATFFFEARTAKKLSRDFNLRAIAKKYEIGCHGYEHEDLTALSEKEKRKVVMKARKTVASLFGTTPAGWSSPYWKSDSSTRRILRDCGFKYEANVCGETEETAEGFVLLRTPKKCALWALMEGKRGAKEHAALLKGDAVIATHSWHTDYGESGKAKDSAERRMRLREIVRLLKSGGARFVTVGELAKGFKGLAR
ncbi:Polysaccharide deacetylase [Candidatus Norongarragalina meridionalis]|nr:Polysaccharide deacetylase [Candidatus Norongarragalina meridionalis]